MLHQLNIGNWTKYYLATVQQWISVRMSSLETKVTQQPYFELHIMAKLQIIILMIWNFSVLQMQHFPLKALQPYASIFRNMIVSLNKICDCTLTLIQAAFLLLVSDDCAVNCIPSCSHTVVCGYSLEQFKTKCF